MAGLSVVERIEARRSPTSSSPLRRSVADVDSLDSDEGEGGPSATIAALRALQRQIARLDRDRYAALSKAAMLRSEIGELEEALAGAEREAAVERPQVDVRAATAASLAAVDAEERAVAALEDDIAALREEALVAAGARAKMQHRRDAAVAAAQARRAYADARLEALEGEDAAADHELLKRHAAETKVSEYERRLEAERALRDSLHEALEEMIEVNKRLASKPRYARKTSASSRKEAKQPPLVAFLRSSAKHQSLRPPPPKAQGATTTKKKKKPRAARSRSRRRRSRSAARRDDSYY